MTTQVSCGQCRAQVDIEKAYHDRPRGFLCGDCHAEDQQGIFAIKAFGLGLMLLSIIVGQLSINGSKRNTDWDTVGTNVHSIDEETGQDIHYAIHVEVAKKPFGDGGNYRYDWQDHVPTGLMDALRGSARFAHNLSFDFDEVLSYPGEITENTNQSLRVKLHAPDGAGSYLVIGKSNDFEVAISD